MGVRTAKRSGVLRYSFLVLSVVVLSWGRIDLSVPARLSLQDQDKDTSFSLEGKVIRQSSEMLTLRCEGNMLFHVRYDSKTEIKNIDGGQGSVKDLRVGVQVKVEGELTESGDVLARRIQLEKSAGPEKSSAPS